MLLFFNQSIKHITTMILTVLTTLTFGGKAVVAISICIIMILIMAHCYYAYEDFRGWIEFLLIKDRLHNTVLKAIWVIMWGSILLPACMAYLLIVSYFQ